MCPPPTPVPAHELAPSRRPAVFDAARADVPVPVSGRTGCAVAGVLLAVVVMVCLWPVRRLGRRPPASAQGLAALDAEQFALRCRHPATAERRGRGR